MSKYPECCYRLGNWFNSKIGERFYWRDTTDESWKEISTLVSITAETLAELARENGERILWSDYVGKSSRKTIMVRSEEGEVSTLEHQINKDEPLGEFFLRVAKERKYIK